MERNKAINLKEGTRVKFIWTDVPEETKEMGWYPPVGTLGTFLRYDELTEMIEVKWDEGTRGDGKWWCGPEDVEVVE